MEYLQTILFFKAFNSLILVMYRLQFHRFKSKCFASNFVLFLNERDGLCKWHQHVKGDVRIQISTME